MIVNRYKYIGPVFVNDKLIKLSITIDVASENIFSAKKDIISEICKRLNISEQHRIRIIFNKIKET